MKTISPMVHRITRLILGFLAFIAVSCGSYQNTSYYDNDGIYGASQKKRSETPTAEAESNSQNLQYKNYFSSLKDDDAVIITDPDSYTSYETDSTSARSAAGYTSWGDSSQNITINVYDNWGWNSWYPSWYVGWNSWYGPSWGWGWGWSAWHPSWYWSWNYPVWYSPYYYSPYYGWHGHHHNYTYYRGGRGDAYNSSLRSASTRQVNGVRSTSFGTRQPTFSNTRANTSTRSQTVQPSRSNPTPSVSPSPRPSRSETRSISTPSRSSSGGDGGGRSGGSYGGSRGGGGGRR
ncbi:MAG TPA: hypothetical protein VKZ68_11015 [Ohtaekwangia sp.]|nr:hypothetical protein [Ohtaekwangia sp.]